LAEGTPCVCGPPTRRQANKRQAPLAVTLHELGASLDNPYYRAFLERSFENHVRQRDLRLICEMRMLETE
jgi:hypothetical protein